MELALGFAPHTGWAIAVIAGGSATKPVVVHRARVQLCPEHLPRQVYHAAQSLPRAAAAQLVDEVDIAVATATREVLAHLLETAKPHGKVQAVGIAGLPRELPALAAALSNHSMLHSAEGELYRGALDDAADALRLPVVPAPPKRAVEEAAAALGTTTTMLADQLSALRSELGAPWQADHKAATAAALMALELSR